MRPKHILITGGSGLIGSKLTTELLNKRYQVSHLSRHRGSDREVKTYRWDINRNYIDADCLDGVDTIIHLAGTGITDKRWTSKRKEQILDSRTKSIALIYDLMRRQGHSIERVISASATGYYSNRGNVLLNEESAPGRDFLGRCCYQWEQAVDKGREFNIQIVKFRTGIVLSTKGGALPVIARPIKWGFGAKLGNGKQWVPWIHIQDVIDMYLFAIENDSIEGTFNMVAPHPVTNKTLTETIAAVLHRPLWLPGVPQSILKLILGEMSLVVLGSTKVSSAKIEQAGYQFKYPEVEDALKQLYG